ncbi:glycosyltransferase family 1 protein [Microlunatus capsulatus]|uniref:Uncharacterized protein n=1 Tax=Microlunatus capsulatus TaxID=99117 RepID=A0ABS4ZBY0_9ACTN|nr:glycosyltransferase family 1 protein [Microlunatus capsulatus]MBP2418567.1 hypothetical protein [Microlunatus capsulatus]
MTAQRWGAGNELTLHEHLVADSTELQLRWPTHPAAADQPLTIGWICTPPTLGSGGHTTMFRMVEGLERAGHRCRLYLYDRHDGDLEAQRRTVREGWPGVRAEVLSSDALPGGSRPTGGRPLDACIATSWESAHVLATLGAAPMQRFYFVQDYEPYFYPRGTEYALAEDSYRFGFHVLALGSMVADCLRSQLGVPSTVVDFGSDTTTYFVKSPPAERTGVVCYARPGNPRRGWAMAELSLTRFHRRHPDVPIRIYGAHLRNLPFPAEIYPRLTPAELNDLYNRSVAGLALSFTNVSLVAEEMLSAGVVPVVNDAPEPRACLTNPSVVWAAGTPSALADALGATVSSGATLDRRATASSPTRGSWATTAGQVVEAVEHHCFARLQEPVHAPAGAS